MCIHYFGKEYLTIHFIRACYTIIRERLSILYIRILLQKISPTNIHKIIFAELSLSLKRSRRLSKKNGQVLYKRTDIIIQNIYFKET